MFQASRFFLVLAAGLAISGLSIRGAVAETWTDISGKFKIEAEYVRVEGKSLVLRKPDGSTINVPIARLSDESRAQAKRLYEMAKSGSSAVPTEPQSPSATTPSPPPPAMQLDFQPPAAPSVPAMAAYPEGASLQETADYLRDQLLAGHPEVLWYALPEDMRAMFDSSEFRAKLVPYIQQQAQTNQRMEQVLMKAVEVLVKKKEFALNTQMLAQVPPPTMDLIRRGYDPAVGLIYEVFSFSSNTKSIDSMTVTQLMDHHGPRIGGHLQALAKLAPAGMIDQFASKIVVKQTSDSSGTITIPNKEGGSKTTELVMFGGRWIPKDLAEKWAVNKDTLVDTLVAQLEAQQQNPQAKQQAEMATNMAVGMAETVLNPLLAAKTQQEFDQAVAQVMSIAASMGLGGGAGPGGPGGGPGGF